MVNAYVHIQQYKYKNDFKVVYDYDQSLDYALVPKLSLQPLVENAFNYGFVDLTCQGVVTIRIFSENKTLHLEVVDNGIGVERAKHNKLNRKRSGIGLSNIKERLKLLYKEQTQFELVSSDQGTIVKFQIPLLISTPYEQGGDYVVEGTAR